MSLHNSIPPKIRAPIKRWNILLTIFILLQLVGWYLALFRIGADTDQGNVYRIIFVHVPIAWCAFFWFFFSALYALFLLFFSPKSATSAQGLTQSNAGQRQVQFDRSSHCSMELGVIFSFLVLVTGSLWGKPTWGVWWDWDPRLTSSLVLFLMGCGYLLLRYFTPNLQAKRRVSAIVSILSALNVPIVYYSVNLWRSLHQPQTFVQSSQNASSDILFVLVFNFAVTFLLSIAIYKIRRQSIAAVETLEEARG